MKKDKQYYISPKASIIPITIWRNILLNGSDPSQGEDMYAVDEDW